MNEDVLSESCNSSSSFPQYLCFYLCLHLHSFVSLGEQVYLYLYLCIPVSLYPGLSGR